MRRAGSPVQRSSSPRMAKSTPAAFSTLTRALATFWVRSSNAAAHPTQYRYSAVPFSAISGTSRPLAQSVRLGTAPWYGWPRFSIPRMAACIVSGKRASSMTRKRRMLMILGIGSMKTGHSWWQAPHVVQDQITSSPITPPTMDLPFPFPLARASRWSRKSMMSPFGVSGFPVTQAGQASWHRPHSVQATRSSKSLRGNPWIVEMPKCSASSRTTGWITPEGWGRRRATLAAAARMWRIKVYGTSAMKAKARTACPHQVTRCNTVCWACVRPVRPRAVTHPPGDQSPQGSRVATIRRPSTANPLTRTARSSQRKRLYPSASRGFHSRWVPAT